MNALKNVFSRIDQDVHKRKNHRQLMCRPFAPPHSVHTNIPITGCSRKPAAGRETLSTSDLAHNQILGFDYWALKFNNKNHIGLDAILKSVGWMVE
ncbi:hypothetical protein RRG08_049886 [Elysia crispata]|uniref:Uncharacterized protein n=1 Tax=Elysia crispata TaxID=231223 RepID=A0AAE0XZQ8_9GAST|nr:hypothetical protein RRG08_049886 [Elysia crispata]